LFRPELVSEFLSRVVLFGQWCPHFSSKICVTHSNFLLPLACERWLPIKTYSLRLGPALRPPLNFEENAFIFPREICPRVPVSEVMSTNLTRGVLLQAYFLPYPHTSIFPPPLPLILSRFFSLPTPLLPLPSPPYPLTPPPLPLSPPHPPPFLFPHPFPSPLINVSSPSTSPPPHYPYSLPYPPLLAPSVPSFKSPLRLPPPAVPPL